MTVHAVAPLQEQGLRAEEIQAEFVDLDLSLIHAALAFYLVNRAQIEADWAADANLEAKLTAAHPEVWAFPTGGGSALISTRTPCGDRWLWRFVPPDWMS